MTKAKAKTTVKLSQALLDHLKEAVYHMEKSWDAQRDIELEIGQEIDGLGSAIEDYAVMGAEALDMNSLKELLESFGIEVEQ